MRTTLVAVSGMSPAIVTETLWALGSETPATVPDEVVVITTSKGENDIKRDLLSQQDAWDGKSVWETLRRDLLKKAGQPARSRKLQLTVRVIELPDEETGIRTKAHDIRTRQHNDEAANFIVESIAPIVDAEDQHVIASIAGGRKTMGALLYAAMSLLGKESDRVTHVLVSDPFDTVRGFFYPEQPVQDLEVRSFGQPTVALKANAARVEMADIPFVPLRNKFPDLNEPRRTFAGMVQTYSRAQRPLTGPPRVTLDIPAAILTVQGKHIPLTGRTLVVASFLHERAAQGKAPFADLTEAAEHYPAYFEQWKKHHLRHRSTARYTPRFDAEGDLSKGDLTKALNELREKLKQHAATATIPYLAPERSRIGFDIAVEI